MRRSLALPAWLLVPVLVLPLVTAKSRAQAAELPGAAERRAALQAMSDAFRAEDLTAALALDAPGLQVVERPQLTAMFRDLNYLRLEQRVLSERALPDGAIEMDVVSTLSSRHVDESADRREKRRWIYVMERGPRGLVIRESHPARIPEIPLDATWDPVSWSGRVTLSPDARRDSGRVEVVLEAVVRNGGVFASRRVGFGLQPFAEGLTVRSGGAGLATSRNESAMDAWMVELPAPVPPGGEVALDMTYAFDQDGAPGAASFGRSGARLFSASGWHPLFRPSRADLPVLASHDLVIDVPAGWTGLAPGRKGPAPAKVSGRAVTRWISEFPGPELAVVAGPFKSMPVPLAGGRRLDVLALAARPAPSAGVRDEAAAAFAWLQHALGPSPLAGFTLVEMPGPAAGAQGMLVLGRLPHFGRGAAHHHIERGGRGNPVLERQRASLAAQDRYSTGRQGDLDRPEGVAGARQPLHRLDLSPRAQRTGRDRLVIYIQH